MIIAILTCHDRRRLTEQALSSMAASADAAGQPFRVVLHDDGSSDGTAEAARRLLPNGVVEVLQGDGSAFWAKGMSTAEARALATAREEDLILWLNDDVSLDREAIADLLAVLGGRDDRIAVGATLDPVTGRMNYGGYVRSGPHPLRFRHVDPGPRPLPLDTFNGNAVLVPVPAARRIGGIEGSFSHSLADIDYGGRANALGIEPLLAPRPVGTCPSHPPVPLRPLVEEWRSFRSIKGGGHPASMRVILRRVRPRTWPIYVAWSSATWWLRALRRHLVRG